MKPVLAAAVLILAMGAPGCSKPESVEPAEQVDPAEQAAPTTEGQAQAGENEQQPSTKPLRILSVLVYYPSAELNGLVGEPREIFMTAAPGDRAKQILADLISGPTTDEALRALPPGTHLRQIFVLDNGTAYADFSADLRRGIGGGSTEELLTIYSIINSVSLNVSEIRKLGILINGRPVETLNGHIDLRRPLPPDRSLIVEDEAGTIVVRARTDTKAPIR